MKSKILVAILSVFFVSNLAIAQSIASNDLNSPKAEIKKVVAPKTESPNIAKPTIDNSVKFRINNIVEIQKLPSAQAKAQRCLLRSNPFHSKSYIISII